MALNREQVVQAAEKLVSRGKVEAAIREYKKVLEENPNDANTLNRVGDLYARIQRIDDAIDFFTQIAEQYTAEGFFVKAIAIYKKIIKLDPTRLEIYEELADLYHKQGLVNEARTQYLVLADYYLKHENPTSAIAIYQKLTRLEPDNPSHHVRLAELYTQRKLTEKALAEHRIIAELMVDHGHAQEAVQVYERGLDIDANSSFLTDAVLKLREAGHAAAAARLLATAGERFPGLAGEVARLVAVGHAAAHPPEPAETPAASPGAAFGLYDSQPFGQDVEELAVAEEPPLPQAAAPAPQAEEPAFGPLQAGPAEALAGRPPSEVTGEFDLDLDDVFVLEMEEEEEPASLVKPPPDMLTAGSRRPAWALDAPVEEAVAPAAAPEPPLDGEALQVDDEVFAESWDLSAAVDEVEEALGGEPGPAAGEPARRPEKAAEGAFTLGPLEEGLEEELSFDLDFPTAEALAPGAGLEPLPPLAALPGEQSIQGFDIDPDLLERTAAELHPARPQEREDEDLVTEAEVLARYGLEEKALERLRDALRINPRHLGAHTLIVQLHLDKGRHARVVELANQMSAAAAGLSNRDPWEKMRKRLAAAGYHVEGERVLAPPQAGEAGAKDSVDQLLRGIIDPALAAPAAPRKRSVRPPAPPEAIAPASPPPPPLPPPTARPSPPAKFDLTEIGRLVDAESFDEEPGGAQAPYPPPGAVPPPAFPAGSSVVPPAGGADAARLDDTGMSWLDEVEAGRGRQAAPGGGAGLFSAEDDFFDLAAELEQELSKEGGFEGSELLVQPAEQSLEQIVEGFKRGVAENLSPTDFDTHFNLGIAYREMGLLDEAIGEFQLAAKSPDLLVTCCSMLGLSFLEKGLPELAIKWYRRGLEAPRVSEEDGLGLLYDLGNAHLAAGDAEAGYKTFVELYGINSNYRDVVAKLEELGPR